MFDLLSLIFGLALAADPQPTLYPPPTLYSGVAGVPPAAVLPECNELFRGHRSVYEGRHFICVDGVWVEQDRSIQPVKPRPP